MKLELPLKYIQVNQPFGVNYVNFYKRMGMKGHNGVDFRAKHGMPVHASHRGRILKAGVDGGGGIAVEIQGDGFKTIYYHLKKVNTTKGKKVGTGSLIGWADNTGKYTTGSHLHFGLKFTDHGSVRDYRNGYHGAVDPAPYFPKNWDKSNAYHRYGRKQEWQAEFKMRFKNPWLHRQLRSRNKINYIYNIEWINALVYGGWDFNAVINPAMADNWRWLTKTQFKKGIIPFT